MNISLHIVRWSTPRVLRTPTSKFRSTFFDFVLLFIFGGGVLRSVLNFCNKDMKL